MCEPEARSGVPGLLLAVGALAAVAAVGGLLAAVAPFVPAVTLTILGMCAAGCEVLRRAILYGRSLRPAGQKYTDQAQNAAVVQTLAPPTYAALTAPPLAIEASNAVVPAVAESERLRA
jgi:hypothetical protein